MQTQGLSLHGGKKKRKLQSLANEHQKQPSGDTCHASRLHFGTRSDDSYDSESDEYSRAASEARTRHMPITTVDWRATLCRVLEAPPSASDEDILDNLEAIFNELKEARRLRHVLDDGHHSPPRKQVIYRVHCGVSGLGVFEMPPWVVESGPYKAHLRGSSPLSNPELYLERNQDIAFIVYVDFQCCQSTSVGHRMRRCDHYHPIDTTILPFMTQESVTIVSEQMGNALEVLAENAMQDIPHPVFFKTTIGDMSTSGDIVFPYLWWFHRREKIDEAVDSLDEQRQQYLSVFRSYIYDRLQHEWNEVDELIAQRRITTGYLNYIYAPGQTLVSKLHSRHVAQIEGYQAAGWLTTTGRHDLVNVSIKVKSWSFDGSFKQVQKVIVLPPPSRATGDFDIEDLAFYPQEFASEETATTLLRRGKMFWKCRKRNYVCHRELTGDGTQSLVDSRFMVDMEMYNQMHATKKDQEPHQWENMVDEVGQEQMDQDEPGFPDGFYMCLPTHTFGFNMQKKEWVSLEVHYLADVQWNTEAFEHLVIDDGTKELIQVVVMNQLSGRANTDLIRGKGNGLFLLLHGGPGTGKTMTAESVAEIAKKPLYRVSCGDIGTKADTVEQYLEVVLHLGSTWGCVVLLDEADVFLEQRSLQNLERNALVSVFLRVLEYYDGILILTSNRVGTFDEAFKSRIQLTLYYNNLGPDERWKIWENFLSHLDNFQKSVKAESTSQAQVEAKIGRGFDISSLEGELEVLSKEKLNGREIRNALSTARQLAMFREERLHYKHLKRVMEETKKFDKYLKEVHRGFTEDDLQRSRNAR